tara:strand:- start:5743 stop:7140 length:1398 start_codon:yes stop_codon:yes gene_type:complete
MIIKIFSLIILVLLFFTVPLGADAFIIWFCLIHVYLVIFYSLRKPIELIQNIPTYLKIDTLFYLFYFILFYLPFQSAVLGLSNIDDNLWLHSNTFSNYSNKSIIASTIGLISFNLGFEKKIIIRNKSVYYSDIRFKKFFKLILFFCVLLLVLFVLLGGLGMLTSSYMGTRTDDAKLDGIYTLAITFISLLGSFSILYYKRLKRFNFNILFSICITLLFALFLLIAGDRNNFFIVVIALLGTYFTFIKILSRKKLVLFGFLALFVYQVVEISRKADNRGIGAMIDVVLGQNDYRTTSKLSANLDEGSFSLTNIVTRSVFHFVPNKHDFFYGKFKLIGIAGIIPYARGLIISPNDPYYSSSRYLTDSIGSHFGLGTSIVADSYIEFGIPSLIVILYCLGLFGNYIKEKARLNHNIKWLIIYAFSLGVFAEIPRYSIDFIIKTLVWSLLFFFIYEFFIIKDKLSLKIR